jgi:hypothetical protein
MVSNIGLSVIYVNRARRAPFRVVESVKIYIDLRRAPVVDDLMLKLKVEVVLCFVFDIIDEKRSKWQPFFV